jgi:hypothetical protein
MQLYSDNAQILVRDGMVSAMHSKKYGWLLPYDVFPIIEEYFRKTWPDFEFKKAVEDDAYLYADYLLHDEVAESSMELILKDLGMGDIKVKAGIRVSTSDVGLSALRFTPFYEFGDGSVRLGKPVEIVHESRNTLEVLKEKYLDLVGVLLKECEDEVEKLGNQMITYPAGCLQHVVLGTRCLSYSMVENAVGEMTVQYPSGCTAIDVYLKLNEIVESNKATCRPGKYLDLLESIGRLLFIDYTKYDIPVSDR